MITIPEEVERVIKKTPYLEEALTLGFLNLSSVARSIKPEIEKKLYKNVQQGAVIMALKRLEERFKKQQRQIKPLLTTLKDITVRSNLLELNFNNSPTLVSKQRLLLERANNRPGSFLTFTQGVFSATLIISTNLALEAGKVFQGEKLNFKLEGLSAVTVTFEADTIKTPGIYYGILKALAWEGINIIEVVSSFNELTIIFEDSQINQAFAVLKSLTTTEKVKIHMRH